MTSRKNIVIMSVLFVGVIVCGYYLWLERKTENILPTNNRTVEFVPYEKRVWNIYIDNQYGYSVEYPNHVIATPLYRQGVTAKSDGVGFDDAELGGYGVMSVSIFEKTNFLNVDEWLREEGKQFNHQRPIIEKRILIDGNEAIVTHMQSDYELDEVTKSEKNTVFIKNRNLFEVRTRFAEYSNHERVWNTFKFN